ncbi:hypothetical protein CBOM_07583 [Ceraceosorus bombacis]|uniref:Uncharacterized protein n=1 Tax=Ceraceosorus bombacis TaxID=401625 RepID=A0A0P1BG27_9BASI|nr:hypothetical protein CBOM_07583 [Ceraceosorus bombacis]
MHGPPILCYGWSEDRPFDPTHPVFQVPRRCSQSMTQCARASGLPPSNSRLPDARRGPLFHRSSKLHGTP